MPRIVSGLLGHLYEIDPEPIEGGRHDCSPGGQCVARFPAGFRRDDPEEHPPATVLPLQRRPARPETWMDKLDQLDAERREAHRHEDVMRIEGRAEGRHKARERISMLLDPGSFNELETFRRHQATGSAWSLVAPTPMA